jgi:general stress protein 26
MARLMDEAREEVWSLIKEAQCVYLATAEGDQPRVRPVSLLNLDEKFWIATTTRSAKARQIRRNPNVEFCLPLQEACGNGYIRIAGVASIVADRETVERIGGRIPFLTDYWEGIGDPNFCLIRIRRIEVEYLRPGEETPTTFIV